MTEVGNENDGVMISVPDIGQYRFRIDMFDANNELLGVNTTYDFQIEEPIYLWNAQGWFDAYGAQVYFHFGYWEDSVDSYTIEKSYSAASGWELVQTVTDLTGNGNQYMDLYLPEYTEGNVDYKVTVYDVDGNSLGEMTVDNIEVNFENREFNTLNGMVVRLATKKHSSVIKIDISKKHLCFLAISLGVSPSALPPTNFSDSTLISLDFCKLFLRLLFILDLVGDISLPFSVGLGMDLLMIALST